jgi:hypothetical protein
VAVGMVVKDNRRQGTPTLGQAVTISHRVCGLCGITFVIVIPPEDPETERDKLCPFCAKLPAPPLDPMSE